MYRHLIWSQRNQNSYNLYLYDADTSIIRNWLFPVHIKDAPPRLLSIRKQVSTEHNNCVFLPTHQSLLMSYNTVNALQLLSILFTHCRPMMVHDTTH